MNSCEISTLTHRFPFAYNRFSDTFIAKGNREGCPYSVCRFQCCIIRLRTSFDPLIKRPQSDLYISVKPPTNKFMGWELWWRISESNR